MAAVQSVAAWGCRMAERVWDVGGAFRCEEERPGREAREAGCMKWLGIRGVREDLDELHRATIR